MSQIPKVRFLDEDGRRIPTIMCPGCGSEHGIWSNKGKWQFNGDIFNPTFTPSVNISWMPSPGCDVKASRCHFHITNGKIIYCNDSTHSLSGKTVDLPGVS